MPHWIMFPDGSQQTWEYELAYDQVTRFIDELERETRYQVDATTGDRLKETWIAGQLDSPSNGALWRD